MAPRTASLFFSHTSRFPHAQGAPPLLVGAAAASLHGWSGGVSGGPSALAPGTPIAAMFFGGWQLPPTSLTTYDSNADGSSSRTPWPVTPAWAVVDDEITWGWVAGGAGQWALLAHGAPTQRAGATLIPFGTDGQVVMVGGHVPGTVSVGASVLSISLVDVGLAAAGGIVDFDLQERARRYWFTDLWLMDGRPNVSGVWRGWDVLLLL